MQGCNPFFMAAPGVMAPCGLPMILFDFDGTLIDSMELCVKEIAETFKTMGLPVPPRAMLEKCNGPSHEETLELLHLPAHLHAEFLRIRGEYQMVLMDSCQKMFPGVTNMLKTLSACASLFIASNGSQNYIDRSVKNWDISQYFTKAVGGKAGRTKGQLIADILQEYQPAKAVMVGDRLIDITAGRENGLYTIAAAYGFGTPEEWREADCKAESVEELLNLCLQFCGL